MDATDAPRASEPGIQPTGDPVDDPVEIQDPNYLVWKKNAAHVYNTLVTASLPWPSLTVEWYPSVDITASETSQNLLLGTRTLGQMPEYVRIGRLTLPKTLSVSLDKYDPETGSFGGFTPQKRDIGFQIIQRIDNQGEVNRARYMPKNQNIIATLSSTGQVAVFDATHYPFNPCGTYKPDIELHGHSAEGFGLGWSPHIEGILATGANDAKLLIWDITKYDSSTGTLTPLQSLQAHDQAVTDLSWHPRHPELLVSVSDDKSMVVSDWRSPKPMLKADFGQETPLSVEYNPSNEYLAAVGLSQGSIELWDLRATASSIHTLKSHADACVAVRWNQHCPVLLASGSQDSSVLVWDVSRVGDDEVDTLRFKHGGHMSAIADVAWNPARPTMLASVGEDNSLHVWEPNAEILAIGGPM